MHCRLICTTIRYRPKIRDEFRNNLMNDMAQLHHESSLFISRVRVMKDEDKDKPTQAAQAKLAHFMDTLAKLQERVLSNSQHQARLSVNNDKGLDRSEEVLQRLANVHDWLSSYDILWKSLQEWQDNIKRWRGISIRELDLVEIKAKSSKAEETAQTLGIKLRSSPGLARLSYDINEFKSLTELLEQLQSPSLKAEHWEALRPFFGHNAHSDSPLSHVLDANMASRNRSVSNVEKIATVTRNAIRQHMLDSLYERVLAQWQRAELDLYDYSTEELLGMRPRCLSSLQLLSVVKLTHAQLSSVTNVGDAATEGPVFVLGKSITVAGATLKKMVVCQEGWMRLAHLFADTADESTTAHSSERFAVDSKAAYQMVLAIWCKCITQLETKNNPLDALSMPGILEAIELCCAKLKFIKWKLQPYLEARRHHFPRMYFLDGEDTFDLLSKSEEPEQVLHFFPRLFSGIASFRFLRPPKPGITTSITGVLSDKRELLKLRNSVQVGHGVPVEVWLAELETSIKSSLWRQIYDASTAIKSDSSMLAIITGHPGQVALVAMQIAWTRRILHQMDLPRNSRRQGIADMHAKADEAMSIMAEHIVQRKFSGSHAASAEAALMMHIYQRDAIAMLMKEKVFAKQDFAWMQHIRMELDVPNEAVVVHQGLGSFRYGLEYLGSPRALAITPLTLRSFTSLTMALQNNIGGGIVGTSQSGKTSIVQSLADVFGYMLISVPLITDQVQSLFLSGVIKSGVWACFDSLDQVPQSTIINFAETFRVIRGQFISSIEATQKVSLDAMMGCFISMPTSIGRKLPQVVKTLFRPTATGLPDFQAICESVLFSKGFSHARVIAKRLKQIHQAAQKISEERHHNFYFGLRLAKLVILDALALRMAENLEELQAIELSARKFLEAGFGDLLDENEGVLAPVFVDATPAPQMQAVDALSFVQYVNRACAKKNFMALPYQTDCVLEVRRAIQDFPATMVLGRPGSGKSTIVELLVKALALKQISDISTAGSSKPAIQKGFGEVLKMFPNGLEPHELGFDDLHALKGWKNNSLLMENLTMDLGERRHVMICDGNVQGKWAEIFTNIVDSTKSIGDDDDDALRMIFEMGDASHTTPGLVSRCKLVHIRQVLPWEALVHSWKPTFLRQYDYSVHLKEQLRESVIGIIVDLVPPALEFVQSLANSAHRSFKFNVNNYMTTFLRMITGVTGEQSGLSKLTSATVEGVVRTLVLRYVVFSWIWAFGGNLENQALRDKFEQFVRTTLFELRLKRRENLVSTIPTEGKGIFSYYVDPVTSSFLTWDAKINTKKAQHLSQLTKVRLVQTGETVAHKYLLSALKQSGPVLFYGPRGIGKTLLLNQIVADDENSQAPDTRYFSLNPFTNRTSVRGTFQKMLTSKAILTGVQRLHVIVDDVSMPPEASLPDDIPMTHDNLRQLLCHKTVFDADNREYVPNHTTNPILCYTTKQAGTLPLNPRMLTELAFLGALAPNQVAQETIFGGLFATFSKTHMPFGDLQAIIKSTVDLFAKIRKHLPDSPKVLRKTFDLRDATRFIMAFASAPEEALASSQPSRLFTHEAMRAFGDGLASREDKAALGVMIEEQAAKLTALKPLEEDLPNRHEAIFTNLHYTEQIVHGFNATDIPYREKELDTAQVADALQCCPKTAMLTSLTGGALAYFPQNVEQILQLARVLSQPQGHALVAGHIGVGKKTVVHVVSKLMDLAYMLVDNPHNMTPVTTAEMTADVCRRCGISGEKVLLHVPAANLTPVVSRLVVALLTGVSFRMIPHSQRASLVQRIRELGSSWSEELYAMDQHEILTMLWERTCHNVRIVITATATDDTWRLPWNNDSSVTSAFHFLWYSPWSEASMRFITSRRLAGMHDTTGTPMESVPEVLVGVFRRTQRYLRSTHNDDDPLAYTIPSSTFISFVNMYRARFEGKALEITQRMYVILKAIRYCEDMVLASDELPSKLRAAFQDEDEHPGALDKLLQAELAHTEQLEVDIEAAQKSLEVASRAYTGVTDARSSERTMSEVCKHLASLGEVDVLAVQQDSSEVTRMVLLSINKILRMPENAPLNEVVARMMNFATADVSQRALNVARKMFSMLANKASIRELHGPFRAFWQWLQVATTPLEQVQTVLFARGNLANSIALARLEGQCSAKATFLKTLVESGSLTGTAVRKISMASVVRYLSNCNRGKQLSSALEREKKDWMTTLEALENKLEWLRKDTIISTACISFFGHCKRDDRAPLVETWSAGTSYLKNNGSAAMNKENVYVWPDSYTNYVNEYAHVEYGPGEVDAALVKEAGICKAPLIVDNQNVSVPWMIDAHTLPDVNILTFTDTSHVDLNARKMVFNTADVNAVTEADTQDWRAHVIVDKDNIALPWILEPINLPDVTYTTINDSNITSIFEGMPKGEDQKNVFVLGKEKLEDKHTFDKCLDKWTQQFVGDTWRTGVPSLKPATFAKTVRRSILGLDAQATGKDNLALTAALEQSPKKLYTTMETFSIDSSSSLEPVHHFELDVDVVQRLLLSTIVCEEMPRVEDAWFDWTSSSRRQSKRKRRQMEYVLDRVIDEMHNGEKGKDTSQRHIIEHAQENTRIEEVLREAAENRVELAVVRNRFVPMANKVTALYLALCRLSDMQPLYFVRFDHFLTNFVAALERARLHATQDSTLTEESRLDHLTEEVLLRMFRLMSFGLTDEDTRLFALGYMTHVQIIDDNFDVEDADSIEWCGHICRTHTWPSLRGSIKQADKPAAATWLTDASWEQSMSLIGNTLGWAFPTICKRFTNSRPIMLLHSNDVDCRFVFQSTLKQMAGADAEYHYVSTRTMSKAQVARVVQKAMKAGDWVLIEETDMHNVHAVNIIAHLVEDIQSNRITAHSKFRLWLAVPMTASLPPSVVGTCSKVCHEWSSSLRSDLLRRLEIVSNKLEYELEFSTSHTLISKRFDDSFTVFPKLKRDSEIAKPAKGQVQMSQKEAKLHFYKEVCFLLALFDATVQPRLKGYAYVDTMMFHAAIQLVDQVTRLFGRSRSFWKPFQRVVIENVYGWEATAEDRKWLAGLAKKILSATFLAKAIKKANLDAMLKSNDVVAFVQTMELPPTLVFDPAPSAAKAKPVRKPVPRARAPAGDAKAATAEKLGAAPATTIIPDDPEAHAAASKIQAGVRGRKVRKEVAEQNAAASKIQAGERGRRVRQEVAEQNAAASKIQAGVRGRKARKEVAEQNAAASEIQAQFRGYLARKDKRTGAGCTVPSATQTLGSVPVETLLENSDAP